MHDADRTRPPSGGHPALFSQRTNWDRTPNLLARALARLVAAGIRILDLTASNPTRCGFDYPSDAILGALTGREGLVYAPDPKGKGSARAAVAGWYAARGREVEPDHIVLCASTSEAYTWAFKLLCEPGERVLVPSPSYPLFDFLARAEGIRLVPYTLAWEGRWTLDLGEIARLADPSTRGIIVVQPNNPTGSFLTREELDGIAGLGAERRMGIISDEVFADFVFDGAPGSGPSALDARAPGDATGHLRLVLGGLSKAVGLPQLKLSWIAVAGGAAERDEALARLDILGDTFLSVNTPVQEGCGAILSAGMSVRDQILERVRRNLDALRSLHDGESAWECLPADGGWYAVVRVPRVRTDEGWAAILLEEDHVHVHPGHFFDFAEEGILVLSLLPEPDVFDEGARRVADRVARETKG